MPAPALDLTPLSPYSPNARVRALAYAVALEAALLAALLSTDGPLTAVLGIANLAALCAVIRISVVTHRRSSRLAESLSRPYPQAIPVLVLAALGPMYMVIAVLTPGRALSVPELALDRALPLLPAWVLVYWSQWVFSFLPVFVVRGHRLR